MRGKESENARLSLLRDPFPLFPQERTSFYAKSMILEKLRRRMGGKRRDLETKIDLTGEDGSM
jgi:hypothetical protein